MQSSGIETLVEELCSRLKDLQNKQGKSPAPGPVFAHSRGESPRNLMEGNLRVDQKKKL